MEFVTDLEVVAGDTDDDTRRLGLAQLAPEEHDNPFAHVRGPVLVPPVHAGR